LDSFHDKLNWLIALCGEGYGLFCLKQQKYVADDGAIEIT
jgi:hypothetical protein